VATGVTLLKNNLATVTAYAAMCAIWGTTWLGIKISLEYLPPIAGVGLRFIIAGLALFLVSVFSREWQGWRQTPWRLVLVLAVFLFGANYVLTYVAETRLDSGLVAVLFGVAPFFIFWFGHMMIGERTNWRIWTGALIAFAGVAVVSTSGHVSGAPPFVVAAIAAAAMSAFAVVYAKKHSHQRPLQTLPPSMLLAGIGVLLFGIVTERHLNLSSALAPRSIAALLYLAVFGSGVAFFLNLWLLRRIEAWAVGLSSLVSPIIALAVGALLGGERPTFTELLGAAAVLFGMTIALLARDPSQQTESAGATL
jgi:drug/metabolite transporter (DMT)-like permease